MERYQEKMKEFVAKLWTNPNIQAAPIFKKENQILGFIRENTQSLQTAFQRPEFFPDISFDDALRLLLTELTEMILAAAKPALDEMLERAAHPALKQYFRDQGGLEFEPNRFRDFALSSMRVKSVRDQYLAVIQAIQGGFYDRYIPPVLNRRKLIYMDIVRRDRMNLESAYLPEYFRLTSLFRPLFYYKIQGGNSDNMSLDQVYKDPRTYSRVRDDLVFVIRDEIGSIPEGVYLPGLDSPLPVEDHPDISGASRLINILVNRAMEFDPHQKQDRGAESPDKSWFNINRRTAKYNGFDTKFLEELYQISGEEGW